LQGQHVHLTAKEDYAYEHRDDDNSDSPPLDDSDFEDDGEEADEAAERLIEAGLTALFPGCVVVGEEGTAADASLLQKLAGAWVKRPALARAGRAFDRLRARFEAAVQPLLVAAEEEGH
jgi:3'-phosphoadenosine 5'-phosphosulfate (PAPS) 3'-phosphatase